MDYLYGKLNNEVKYREYKGSETTTATVTIDDSSTVSVDVKKVPNELTLTTINGDTYTYDGSEPASFDIRTQVTDKVEEGNSLPVTSDAVKGYVDSKAEALEYVGGEGNFTNINGGVTVKGRLNVDDGIYSPITSDDPNFVPNNKSVDDKITASEQKLIDERIGAFTRTEDKLFTDVEGGMTVKGHLNVDGGITSASAPTSYKDVTNKGYVDNSRLSYIGTTSIKSAIHDDTGIHLKSSTTMRTKAGLDYQGSTEMLIPIVGKDGVIIENDSDSIVAVKADVEAIQKDMAGRFGNNSLWYTSTTGEPSGFGVTDAGDSGAIPVITDGLRLPETIPDENYVAVHKKYVDDGFAPKQIPADTRSAYTTNTNGEQSLITIHGGSAVPFSIASRSEGGVVRVGNPVADQDAIPKKYADEHYAPLLTSDNPWYPYFYTVYGNNAPTLTGGSLGKDSTTVAIRGEGGRLQVGAPEDVADATTKKYVDDADAKKLNLTGGTITGSLAIQGDLTVTGTTTTEKAQTLAVKDSVIVTNADGAELGSTLSGIAIRKDGENTYGVMYDPSGDSVKLGLGTLDAENKFTFNESGTDGKPIATRADSSALTDGDLVKWDGTTNSLVDSGKKTDDFVEKVTVTEGSNLAYIAKNDGTQSTVPIAQMPYQNTVAQRGAGGTLKVGTAVSDSDAMPKKQVDDNFVAKVTTGNHRQAYTVDDNNQQVMLSIDEGTGAWTLARRYAGGRLQVATPLGTPDATNKKYVDDADSKKVNLIDGLTAGAVVYATETANGTTIGIPYSANTPDSDSIVQRQQNGVIVVGTPTSDATDAAVNIEYANANYVAKVTAKNIAYTTDNNGVAITTHMSFNPTAWDLATFDGFACLRTSDPTGDDGRQCVNKQYADAHYVKSVAGTANAPAVYIRDEDGTDKTAPIGRTTYTAFTMVQRDSDGTIRTATPIRNSDAVNKQYAEDNFVTKGTVNQAVYVRRSNGTDTMIPYTDGSSQETIAYRGVGGVLGVGTPTQAGHATTKAYVDNLNAITITAGA